MVRKAWFRRRGAQGRDPEPKPSLSQDRLALLHRYMTGTRDVPETRQRVVETLATKAPSDRSTVESQALKAQVAAAGPQTVVMNPADSRTSRKAALSERWAATKAARAAASAERREARERKALAKAAARRRT